MADAQNFYYYKFHKYPKHSFSDPYKLEPVKRRDRALHQALSKIPSGQMKKLLHYFDQNSIFKLLLEKNPSLVKIFPKDKKLPLLWIAVMGHYQDSAELLVRSGAKVNERKENITILHLLLKMYPSSWNDRFIALLTDYDADLNARDYNDETSLHYAVTRGRVQALKLLLEKGANVNAVDIGGRTPVLRAARMAEADEMLPLLLKHGADVTFRRDFHGKNVLHHLAFAPGEHADMARALMEKGASMYDRERDFRYQPIHLAALKGKDELVSKRIFYNILMSRDWGYSL